MQFTGITSIFLPQKSGFSFALYNINLSAATGITNFVFSDTGNNQIQFQFSGGLILLGPSNNKIISTYSEIGTNLINITGFYINNVLNYQINGIFGQQGYNFSNLNTLTVSGGQNPISLDVYAFSQPINYTINFPSYNAGQNLTGTITSDTNFYINSSSMIFLNSNNFIPFGNTNQSLIIETGTNYVIYSDTDNSLYEYYNNFIVTFNTPFGIIGGPFQTYRGNIYNQISVSVNDYDSNIYWIQSLFDGNWTENNFIYIDNPLTYNLSYYLQTMNLEGYEMPTNLSAKFQPSLPLNGSGYSAHYITGFQLTNSGLYSGQSPIATFSQYYYITGINQQFQNMLFSTGCGTGINISFTGPSSGAASGFLSMTSVNVSGVYGAGINSFNIVEGYTPLNSGSGYTIAPTVIWGTGGNCYSLPDKSGFNVAQFQQINGLQGITLGHAAGLTGFPLLDTINGTGFSVTGMQITNIGYGYHSLYPPTITFIRWTGDVLTNNASGNILYKSTGTYNFTGNWNISYNFLNSNNVFLTNFGTYYSGNMTMPSGYNTINFQITLTGLDNTGPVSGLLTLAIPFYSGVILDTKNIIQSRYYNLNTGALYSNYALVNPFVPLPNFDYLYSGNQNGAQYFNDFNNL